MRPILLRLPVHSAAACLLAAVAALGGCDDPAAVPGAEDPQVTVRSWRDSVKRHHLRSPRRVHLVVDYGDGSVTEQSRAPNQYRQDRPAPRAPAPSPAELESAFALARAHPDVSKLATSDQLELSGGFLVNDDSTAGAGLCGTGSRCLEIVALYPGDPHPLGLIVVDLISRQVAVEARRVGG